MAACIDECVAFASNGDTAARAAIASGEAQCATSCTTTAAKKFEEVSKECAKMKSTHCKRGKDCKEDCEVGDSKCEKKKEECEDDFDDCEECEDELEKAEKSVKKVGNELQKCFVKDCGVEFSSFRAIALQEDTEIFEDTSLQTNQEALESCQCTPDSKDADKLIGETEAELAASMAACVEECYGITSDDPAARSSEAQCALSCTVTAAEKFEEVSKGCEKMKSTHCKNDCDKDCAEGDSSCENEVEKCEKEFEECEKCADEVDELERSLDKVASTYDSCVAKGCVTQFAVEVAQQ